MLLAQLHRKVPNEFEGMEDVLTSSVIGLFRYLPGQIACALLAQFASTPVVQVSLKIEPWPRYPTPPGFRSPIAEPETEEEPAGRGDTEPDAIITTPDWLVLVEAKYRSQLDETYDQLGREFAIGYQLAQNTGRQFRLLIITGHTLQPAPGGRDLVSGVRSALTAASARLGDVAVEMIDAVRDSLRWTNWQRLYSILLEASENQEISIDTRCFLIDVCLLLELRGLKPYDVRSVARTMAHWDEAGILDVAWSMPILYRYRTIPSISAGWEQLLCLDTTVLAQLAWRLKLSTANYDPGAYLAHFQLDSLDDPAWHPFARSGE